MLKGTSPYIYSELLRKVPATAVFGLAPSPLHFALRAKVFRPTGLKAREEFY
jgi:hypothetical protein